MYPYFLVGEKHLRRLQLTSPNGESLGVDG